MTEYYHIVPWYSSEEWHKVYNMIFNHKEPNVVVGLKMMQIWKARCPSLPSGIESTLSLLKVQMHDERFGEDIGYDQLLRLAYSSAIMRFVNHVLDNETAKGTSLYQAAKNLGVPDWIVDLRHDTAHSNNLPHLSLLKEATIFCLNWLQMNYWDKHKLTIQDYKCGQTEVDAGDDNKIAALMHFCMSLSICAHSKCNIKKLSDIPNPSMRESIVHDARDLLGDNIDLSNLKTVSIMSLINVMNVQSKKLMKTKDIPLHTNKALLGEDALFLSLELLNLLSGQEFRHKRKLNRSYVQCFEVLLTFLHTNDLLSEFILGLIKVTENESNKHKAHLAALWVAEILAALTKSKQFIDKMNKVSTENMNLKKRKELKSLYHHWFPNEKSSGLILDLCKPVPSDFMDINFVQPILSSYNQYLTYFVKDLLNLIEPKLPSSVIAKIIKLTQLISKPEIFPANFSSKIYTIDDLKSVSNAIDLSSETVQGNQLDDDSDETYYKNNEDMLVNSIWKLASRDHNWSLYPIGQLPGQKQSDVSMET